MALVVFHYWVHVQIDLSQEGVLRILGLLCCMVLGLNH